MENEALAWILAVVASYLIGSIPTGYLAGRLRGVDIRTQGSGNLGATNVLRVLGWPTALLVLLIDVGKGLLAVTLLPRLTPYPGLEWIRIACGLAAVIGNTYTVFLGFRGGKGVATSCGVFLALAPVSTLLGLGVFTAVIAATRYVSAGSLAAAVLFPFLVWVTGESGRQQAILGLALVLAVVLIVRHRSNLVRLLNGTERRFGKKPPEDESRRAT